MIPAASFIAAQGPLPVPVIAQAATPVGPAPNAHGAPPVAVPPVLSGGQALAELKKGNINHVRGHNKREYSNEVGPVKDSHGQKPHAIILSCSDLQVPPETVFDKGLDDLFVVRVAGNFAGTTEMASIEHATQQLNVPLLVVMGHRHCRVIQAAAGTEATAGQITDRIKQIRPSVDRARRISGDLVDNAVHTNIEDVVANLRRSQPLNQKVEAGALKIVGAYYDLDTGKVDWLY